MSKATKQASALGRPAFAIEIAGIKAPDVRKASVELKHVYSKIAKRWTKLELSFRFHHLFLFMLTVTQVAFALVYLQKNNLANPIAWIAGDFIFWTFFYFVVMRVIWETNSNEFFDELREQFKEASIRVQVERQQTIVDAVQAFSVIQYFWFRERIFTKYIGDIWTGLNGYLGSFIVSAAFLYAAVNELEPHTDAWFLGYAIARTIAFRLLALDFDRRLRKHWQDQFDWATPIGEQLNKLLTEVLELRKRVR